MAGLIARLLAGLMLCQLLMAPMSVIAAEPPAGPIPEAGAPETKPPMLDLSKYIDLAVFKTVSYQSIVVVTDAIIYAALMDAEVQGGGLFNAINGVTSPAVYYGFEEVWNSCCATPPNADGSTSVNWVKAAIYRTISTTRTMIIALALGHEALPALGLAAAIALTRTGVYIANDYTWANYSASIANAIHLDLPKR